MKILGLVLALALVVAGGCVADSVTMNIYTGWQIIGTPLALYDGTPSLVFANVFSQVHQSERLLEHDRTRERCLLRLHEPGCVRQDYAWTGLLDPTEDDRDDGDDHRFPGWPYDGQ